MSVLPYLDTFRRLLADVVSAARGSPAARGLVAQLFHAVPLPPDHTTQVVFYAGPRSVSLLDQSFARDFSFRPLLACLRIERVKKLLVLMLLERKVVLATQRMSRALLYAVCEVARALLFPLDWEHVYIPVLPPGDSWRRYLECPAPYVIGVVDRPDAICEDVKDNPDVYIFDLDNDRVLDSARGEPLPSSAPALEGPLQRLKDMFDWEQGHREYWDSFHLVQASPSRRAGDAAAAAPGPTRLARRLALGGAAAWSPEGDASHQAALGAHAGSYLSASTEPTEDSPGSAEEEEEVPRRRREGRFATAPAAAAARHSPYWSEDTEKNFRQKVSATFLEVFVKLLHAYPGYAVAAEAGTVAFDEEAFLAQAQPADVPLLRKLFRTNTWDNFIHLSPDHPRVRLFRQAIDLYGAWMQVPPSGRRPFDDELRLMVAKFYEPANTVAAPEHPGRPLGPLCYRSRQRGKSFAPIGSLGLALLEGPTAGTGPRPGLAVPAAALRHTQVPAAASQLFVEAVGPALAMLQEQPPWPLPLLAQLLRQLAVEPSGGLRCAPEATRAAASEEALSPDKLLALGESEEVVQMHAACFLPGVGDIRDSCPDCGCDGSLWDTIRASLAAAGPRGGLLGEQYAQPPCARCGRPWEPRFGFLSGAAGRTPGQGALPLLTVPECVGRIRESDGNQEEVAWCLRVFFGLRVEISVAGAAVGCATFEALCRAYARRSAASRAAAREGPVGGSALAAASADPRVQGEGAVAKNSFAMTLDGAATGPALGRAHDVELSDAADAAASDDDAASDAADAAEADLWLDQKARTPRTPGTPAGRGTPAGDLPNSESSGLNVPPAAAPSARLPAAPLEAAPVQTLPPTPTRLEEAFAGAAREVSAADADDRRSDDLAATDRTRLAEATCEGSLQDLMATARDRTQLMEAALLETTLRPPSTEAFWAPRAREGDEPPAEAALPPAARTRCGSAAAAGHLGRRWPAQGSGGRL
ncbi:unnamed protein product, partial [Prorocentrum cordatum]